MNDDPFDNPLLWDKLTLEGGAGKFVIPGRVRIDGDIGLNEDSIDVPGQDGLQKTLLGYKPATFNVDIQIWTPEQFALIKKIVAAFRPKNGEPAKAVTAIHPQIQLLGVKQVYITGLTPGAYSPVDGYTMTLKLEQWFQKITGKLNKTTTGNSNNTGTRKVETRSSSSSSPAPTKGGEITPKGNDWAQPYVPPSTTPPGPKK